MKRFGTMCDCEIEEKQKIEENEATQLRIKKLMELKRYSLMDEEFYECKFENFELRDSDRESYNLAKNYCDNWQQMKKENIGFLFWGTPGIGKTYLTYCIANELIERLVPVIAISTIGIINKIYEGYNKWGSEGEASIINSLKNADLLIIDDIGAEHESEKGKQIIYSIIDTRSRGKLPTISTTNITPRELKDRLTQRDLVPRTADRLFELCYPVEIKGESRRVENARKKGNIINALKGERRE